MFLALVKTRFRRRDARGECKYGLNIKAAYRFTHQRLLSDVRTVSAVCVRSSRLKMTKVGHQFEALLCPFSFSFRLNFFCLYVCTVKVLNVTI